MATRYDVTPDTNLLKLARTIAHGLASGPVEIDGEFQRLRRLYIELVERMAPAARARLANLVIPLGSKFPDVKSRLNRRIGDGRGGSLVPLEHLLLTGDFPPASNITDTLFPEREHLKSGVKVSFNDPKGLISLGQHRAVLAVLDELDRRSPAAALSYVIERRHEHVTFHHPVQVHSGVARATIDVAQLEKRSDFARALRDELEAATAGAEPVWLDADFVRYDQSCAWDFNRAFWRYLSVWENVTGKSYQRALPKGKAESNHQEFIDEAAARLADHVRELEREGSLAPDEELWVSEKAPGSGGFMAGLLDYFRKNHPDYYRRLRVVLSDISADVLSISAHELNRRGHLPAPAEGPRIMFWPLGGGRPPETAGGEFVDDVPRGRFIYMRHANFFDQLPTRLFAHQGGRYYELYVRAAIDPEKLATFEEKYDLTLARLREVIGEAVDLATLDADLKARFINFWSAVWESVKLREDFRPVAHMADVHADGAEIERLFDAAGDLRFVTSDVAIAIMREDLRLLHPTNGYACFTDIFLQRAAEFNERWIELAKYDNGVWVGTNGLLMTHLLGRDGYRCGYYPVELTLGSPSAVYTMSVSRGDEAGFALTPELIQELTGIAAAEVQESSLTGLPRRVRNNLRDLPALMDSVEPDLDWGRRTFDDSLDLTRLMRELYYHSPPSVGENSLFVKMAALVGDLVDRYRGRRIRIDVDLTEHDLRALEDFLDHRPIAELPLELARIGGNGNGDGPHGNGDADEFVRVRIRLLTIAHKLRHNEFLMLAEVDLPRAQSLEQLRRRILQFQRHVDAVSLTSGRMADPRFLRSREMLKMPLFRMVQPDRLFVTLEMCERQAADLESDIRGAEAHGVHNIFIVTGDFDRGARWWLDSPHGIALADRLRNGEGADGRLVEHRSRSLVAGALTWSGIPDITSRIERDIELKVRAGADLLFTQPVYDLKLSTGMLDMMAARGLASEVRVVAEILPLLSLEMIRTLSQTPGINVPPEMLAAYERIDANVGAFYGDAGIAALDSEAQATLFADRVFAGVVDIPGFEGFFSADRAKAIYRPISKAVADARSKTSKGKEFEEGRRAAGRAALTEIGFAMAERIMAALVNHGRVAGFLFVARNGRDLRRLTARTNKLLADDASARAARNSDNHRAAHISAERGRRYGHELVEVADRLAPLGLALPDGTPTNLRMPAVIQSATREGPTVVTRLDLDDIDETGRLPLEFETLAEALGRRPADDLDASDGSPDQSPDRSIDLRVLCVPAGWERNSALMRTTVETADCEIRMNLRAADAVATGSRRLRVRVHGEPIKARIARAIERHPHLYGVAVLGEFWIKHPIFGQVLCGGPCGISGAWQFTCTMGKTFTSKRQIENNLLNRPIFIAARQNAAASTIRRKAWAGYERVMRAMLWPPIALRRGIVAVAGRIPSEWYLDAKGVFQAAVTRAVNHLECPKSLRNGACGAPSATGLCGELMKFGINKPCVFCYRNARDRRGHERAEALVARARRLRAGRLGRIAAPAAALMEIAAAFADRRPLSVQLYPRVDTEIPGASAIVNSMARRYEGATVFGNPDLIPPSIAHSEIELEVRTPESRKILAEVRRRLRNVAPLFENRGLIVATMLEALASSAAGFRPRHERDGREDTTYERMFMAQIGAPPRRADRHP